MIPFPLIGHDDFKAWGLTMFENDELDLYKEKFNPDNQLQVWDDSLWVNCKIVKETIHLPQGYNH